MGRNERLQELQEERAGIVSLRNTLIFAKWALFLIGMASIAIVAVNFIQLDVFYGSYAGIAIVFFSFAALLDMGITRVRVWVDEVEEEITALQQRSQEYDDNY
ncbi:MAG: hypothetical protein ACRCWD_08320 [Culicoidibacterales bacterium]